MAQSVEGFVSFTHPLTTWEHEPTYLVLQCVVIFGVVLNFIHSWRAGGPYYYIWWSTIVVSIVTELVCYWMPSINNFWHAQGIVTFAGGRFPLYIVVIYNQFWYLAYVAVSRAGLSWWAEPFATGLLTVALDLPYDIMGARMLWWTWHDTDPNIYDRHMHVPWTSYYFHSAFCSMLMIVYFGLRKLVTPKQDKFEARSAAIEWLCAILSGCLAMPLASLLFISLFYNTLHDVYGIHSEVPVIMWLSSLILIFWCSDRQSGMAAARKRRCIGLSDLLSLPVVNVLQYFTFFIVLMFFAKPEQVRSTGLHQEVGNCSALESTFTITGAEMPRRRHLCLVDYLEPFDFGCLKKEEIPKEGDQWYTICGLPYDNEMEYKFIIWFACAAGLFIYLQLLLFSGEQPQLANKPSNSDKKSNNSKYKKKKA